MADLVRQDTRIHVSLKVDIIDKSDAYFECRVHGYLMVLMVCNIGGDPAAAMILSYVITALSTGAAFHSQGIM